MSFFGPPNPGANFDKRKYEHLTMAIRQTVLERAHNRCQKCSTKFSPSIQPQFEHINGNRKDNRPSNLHALCPQCFKAVEEKENRKGLMGNLKTAFNRLPVDFKK